MKKWLCATLCAVLLLAALPQMKALAIDVSPVMQVVKCKDYVSLRKSPDKKSDRLKKVHLGELVTECVDAGNDFVYCKWGDTYGYILGEYLQKRMDISKPQYVMKNQMVYNCNEYVSLRADPDSKSERLIKVPLGAIVTGCINWPGDFIKCEYKGKTGYIMAKYLKTADYTVKVTPTPTIRPSATPTPRIAPSASPAVVYPPLPFAMVVANCNEWVSLRARPTPNSAQLKRVPLGTVVYECVQVSDTYAYCRVDEAYGYISLQYLSAYIAEEPQNTKSPFEDLDRPSMEQLKAAGEEILESSFNGYTVIARRAFFGDAEDMVVACYDPTGKWLWQTGEYVDQATELTSTSAFVAGTADKPLIVTFTSGIGLKAYEIGPWSDEVWSLTSGAALEISGGISTNVLKDGTIYIIGYYDASPVCISNEGQILWVGQNEDLDVYWPVSIIANDAYIQVVYDSYMESQDYCYVLTYGSDGSLRRKAIRPKTEYPDVYDYLVIQEGQAAE